MKKLLLLILLVPFTYLLKAQDGVFLTYEDFKNNKVVPADGKSMNYNFGKKASAWLKQNGEKRTWKLHESWGLRFNGEIFRSTHGDVEDALAKIIQIGDCVYYEISYRAGNGSGTSEITDSYISKDLNSKFYAPTDESKTLRVWLKDHKAEFKELAECSEKSTSKLSRDIIVDCIKSSKEYKPLKVALPQLQPKD